MTVKNTCACLSRRLVRVTVFTRTMGPVDTRRSLGNRAVGSETELENAIYKSKENAAKKAAERQQTTNA